ncbi:LL-diaminopimelate aminotransferase [Paludibacteraceae bacterium OttesenSCG-928-F17]|nr:LL-diaminopimelate aminotransferase [Paludibacteraceae bacterium OttesenSCG-928-F17]
MALANENFLKAPQIFYSPDIKKRINTYKLLHPHKKIINLFDGDVTQPLTNEAISALHKAVDEMAKAETFKGYSPFQGYDFLLEKIIKEYRGWGVNLDKESIFVNTGAKSDLGNVGHVLGHDNIIALTDPVYPIYENATIMSGRAGELWEGNSKWSNIVYLNCSEATDFIPQLPEERVDIIFFCNPSNPTGTALTRKELKKWVDYALENKSIILYDSAYCDFITDDDVPHSIYEIKNAKKVAVEIKTYSKVAGFTGLCCGYTVVPSELMVYTKTGEEVSLIELWKRKTVNYTNGVSYLAQRAAESLYTRKGKKELKELVDYYLNNARILKEGFTKLGYKTYGADNAPYVWIKIKDEIDSMQFFQQFLYDYAIIAMPGIMFGPLGEGYMRLMAFASQEDVIEAIQRIRG